MPRGAGRLRLPVPLSEPPQPATSATASSAAMATSGLRGTGGIVVGATYRVAGAH